MDNTGSAYIQQLTVSVKRYSVLSGPPIRISVIDGNILHVIGWVSKPKSLAFCSSDMNNCEKVYFCKAWYLLNLLLVHSAKKRKTFFISVSKGILLSLVGDENANFLPCSNGINCVFLVS